MGIDKDGFHIMEVKPSNIAKVGFIPSSAHVSIGTLRVWFKNGSIYDYQGVSKLSYDEFITAKSAGSYFASKIANKFKYVKIADKGGKSYDKEEEEKKKARAEKIKGILYEVDEKILSGEYDYLHARPQGLRSRQVMALIDILVDRGIL